MKCRVFYSTITMSPLTGPTIQFTPEQFAELIHRTVASRPTFASCRLQFHGERNRKKVEEFITHVTCYKQIQQISDDDALMSFPLLLKDEAFLWCRSVFSGMKTWTDMLDKFKKNFIPRLKPHEVYAELFSKPQEDNEDIYYFVTRKRELLSLLPANRHTEEEQLDFCYGMLNAQMKKNTRRSEIKCFADLYEKGLVIQSEVEQQKTYEELKRSVEEERETGKQTVLMHAEMNDVDDRNNQKKRECVCIGPIIVVDKKAGKKCSFCNKPVVE